MGLATVDSHSLKELTEIHKIPKFGVNQASFHWDTAIWKCQNLQSWTRSFSSSLLHLSWAFLFLADESTTRREEVDPGIELSFAERKGFRNESGVVVDGDGLGFLRM